MLFFNPCIVINVIIQLLFLTFSVLVANPKKLLYTVAHPARGLLNRGGGGEVWQRIPPPPLCCPFGENEVK